MFPHFAWLLLTSPLATSVPTAEGLRTFDAGRLHLNAQGLAVLGAWAVINLLLSAILTARTVGARRAFWQMNGYWNLVNLALAGYGYYAATHDASAALTLLDTLKAHFATEKIFLFNAALDVAYVTGGLYLRERGKNLPARADQLRGFGQSVILQGAFLFIFDLAMYLIHQRHLTQLTQ